MEYLSILAVPLSIFALVVMPLWLVLHYRAKRVIGSGLEESERESLDRLTQQADDLGQRIESLEQILDSEVPGWRNRYRR